MQLARTRPTKALISLVPMIDVMLILLVFFMVTSTYLNLDMIPVVDTAEPAATQAEPSAATSTILVHLASDGSPRVRGKALSQESFAALLRDQLTKQPLTNIVLLPSGGASMQQLVSVMDTATQAGATRLRLIRLDANPTVAQ